jgi:tetratricopeptide (TPR) repeat protein
LPLARRAAELNPEAPTFIHGPMWVLLDMRDFEGAEAEAYRLLERGYDTNEVHWALFEIRVEQGRFDEAREEYLRARELDTVDAGPFYDLNDALIAVRSGDSAGARAIIEEVERHSDHWLWTANLGWIAALYGDLGETELAFEYLERAFAENSHSLIPILVTTWYDPLRGDPRFDELTSRITLAE